MSVPNKSAKLTLAPPRRLSGMVGIKKRQGDDPRLALQGFPPFLVNQGAGSYRS